MKIPTAENFHILLITPSETNDNLRQKIFILMNVELYMTSHVIHNNEP